MLPSDPDNDLAWLLVSARAKHALSPEPVEASSHAPQLLLAAPVATAASYIDKKFELAPRGARGRGIVENCKGVCAAEQMPRTNSRPGVGKRDCSTKKVAEHIETGRSVGHFLR